MIINSQTKTLLAVLAILGLIYFLYRRSETPVKNEGALPSNTAKSESSNQNNNNADNESASDSQYTDDDSSVYSDNSDSTSNDSSVSQNQGKASGVSASSGGQCAGQIPIPTQEQLNYFPPTDYTAPTSDYLSMKFNNRNQAKNGYKNVSYSGSDRGNLGPSDWEDYFDHNNNVVGNAQTGENDKFLPIDESSGGFAVFKSDGRATCGGNQNCQPEDLFDVDKYLPQEVNDDWFEVQPEPISVKNRHLINITKPIGINTIGSSLRNASWDIRGAPACPKYVVSPWLGSSIEPDTNLKPLM